MEGTNIQALYGSPTIPTKTDVGGSPRGQRPSGSPPLTPGSSGGSASDIYNDPTPIKQTTIPKELPGFGTTDTSGMGGELNPEKKWIQTNEGGFVEQPALSQKPTVQAGEKPTGSPVTIPKQSGKKDRSAPDRKPKPRSGYRIEYDAKGQPILTNVDSGKIFANEKGEGGLTNEQINKGDIRKLTALNQQTLPEQRTRP